MSCDVNTRFMEDAYEEGYAEGIVIGEDEMALTGRPLEEFAEEYAEKYAREKFEAMS